MDSKKTLSEIKSAKESSEYISHALNMLEKGIVDDINFGDVEKRILLLGEQFKNIKGVCENNLTKLKRMKTLISQNSKKYSFEITYHEDGIHMMINSKGGMFGGEKHHMYLLVNNSGELFDMIYNADSELLKLVSDASKAVFGKEPMTFNTTPGHH